MNFCFPACRLKDRLSKRAGIALIIIVLFAQTTKLNAQNNALSFDGSNDFVSVPALGTGYNQFTIETWINPASLAAAGGFNGLFNTNNWTTNGDIHFQINNAKIELAVNASTIADVPYSSFTLNNWHHLAVTYNAVTKKVCIYVNGTLLQSLTLTDAVQANFSAAEIGAWNSTRYFNGIIDEYRIWSTERTSSEIKDNMFSSMTGTETGLLAAFSCNQGTAGGANSGLTTLINSKGSNNGTLNYFNLSGTVSNWVSSFKSVPVSHAASFTGTLVSDKITLTWIDATGSVIPDAYLILASKSNSFTDPINGVMPADDNDLSDGVGVMRISKGVQSYNGWINEEINTTYYFRIYSVTNTGNTVQYYTSGTIPQVQVVSRQILSPVTSNFPQFTGPIWADYNNDGFLDLLVWLDNLERTALYRNNQNNTFTIITYFNLPSFESNIGWTDIDLNGYLDMTGGVTMYYNNSGASFIPAASTILGLSDLKGEWGDFDNDADNDFLTRASNGYEIKIYRRNSGFYNELYGNTFLPCEGVIKWIDYNNDGYLDIFATGKNPLDGKEYSSLYKNEGGGKFTRQTQISLPALKDASVCIADINSDGRIDILLSGNKTDNTGTVILCTNVDGSSFTSTTIAGFYDCSNNPAPAVVDLNNDGLNDIIISAKNNETDGIVKIFRNNGNSSFSEFFSQSIAGSTAGLGLFDLNNDNNIDLVEGWSQVLQNTVSASNAFPGKITSATAVPEGNGVRFNWTGTDDKTPAAGLTYELRIGTTPGASNIIAANSIGSGKRKLYTMGNMGSATSKYLQLPKGTYYWGVQAIDNSFRGGAFSDEKSFIISDVPSSGLTAEKIDNYSLKLKWIKGNGAKRAVFCKIGTSGTAAPVNNKTYIASPSFGEGDQILSSGWYCLYNGTGDSVNVSNLSSSNSYIFHVTEYNGNSGSESYVLATANGNPGVFSTAVFSEQAAIPVPDNYGYDSRVSVGDFNNDKLLDFLYNFQGVTYNYTNQGNNTFTQATVSSPRSFNNSLIRVVDFNNDGFPDFSETGDVYVAWQRYPAFTRFFKNNGNNTFTEIYDAESAGTINNSMDWTDYDNDGYVDYFLGGNKPTVSEIAEYPYAQTNYTRISKIFRNKGPAGSYSFSEQTEIVLPGLSNGAARWGDFNNDGWPDLLLTGIADDDIYYIYLYINSKNNSFIQHRIEYNGPGSSVSHLECADFDKNGFLDFILAPDFADVILFLNNGDNSFTQDLTSFSEQKSLGQFVTGDFNNDKAVDVMFMHSGTPFKRLYINNYPGKTFSIVNDFISTGSGAGNIAAGDYDNDGDLDIFSSDNGATPAVCNIIKNSVVMKSGNFPVNTLPEAPVNLKSTIVPGKLLINWDYVTSDESPNLSYNLKLEKDGVVINSPNSILSGGKRLIPGMGNTGLNNFAILKGLPAGTYNIAVQAIDGTFAGGPWSESYSVDIKNTTAFFTFDTVCFKAKTKVSDLSTSTSKIVSRQWIHNNITFSTDSVAFFSFPAAGTDSVSLIITDSEGAKDTVTHKIYVKPRPVADFTATTVCMGLPTVFSNNSSRNGAGAVTWSWNYDNGDPASTDSIPLNKIYGLAKTYNAILTVTASNGCADTLARDVIVAAIPNVVTSVNGLTTFCSGDSVLLEVENNPSYNYKWQLNNNDLTGSHSNSFAVKTFSGSYTVKVTNPLANCIATSAPVAVVIKEMPDAPTILVSDPTTICAGDSTELRVTAIAGHSYLWKLNDGSTGLSSENIFAKNTGIYSLVVRNSTGCSSSSLNQVALTVKPLPVKSTITLIGEEKFCNDKSANLSVPFDNNYTYTWKKGDVSLGSNSNSITVNESGDYTAEISLSGCTLTTPSRRIDVVQKPVKPVIDYGTYSKGECLKEDPIVLSVGNIVPDITYKWYRNGALLNTSSSIETRDAGRYYVTADNETCSDSASLTIDLPQILPEPQIHVQGPPVWMLSTVSNPNYLYRWYFNGTAITGAEGYSYVAGQKLGLYRVAISDDGICYAFSDTMRIPKGITGIEDADPFSEVKIYPNPTSGLFTIEMNNSIFGELVIDIFSQKGSKVLKIKFDKTTEHFSTRIDLSGQSKGMYLVNLSLDKYRVVRKVLVE